MDLSELQKQLDAQTFKMNNEGLPIFEGYSPFEMHQILNNLFGAECPIQLNKLQDADYKRIPIFNLIKYLAHLIAQSGEIKLTKTGNLPVKVVVELYSQGFFKEYYIEVGFTKLNNELNSLSVRLTKIILEIAGLTKKRNEKLSLTKLADKVLNDNDALLRLIIETLTYKFNWAFFDGYGDNQVGQLGCGYSLFLMSKYGQQQRTTSFYAQKYFIAFPQLMKSMDVSYGTLEQISMHCYEHRFFQLFALYLGIVEISFDRKDFAAEKYVVNTDLFDKLLTCSPHR